MIKGVSEFCGDSHRCSPKNHPQSIMDYFELYYAYLAWCEKDNWANYRDPNHDFMEWNHTLPQCIFGDQPVGQWLTIEQHAIASALQTLAFRKNCLCGWHIKWLPEEIRSETAFYHRKACKEAAKKSHAKKDENGFSVNVTRLNAEKDEFGRSVQGVRNAEKLHREKDDQGRSLFALARARKMHADKDELGRSLFAIRSAEKTHSKKDEQGRSLAVMKTNNQIWESTIDGFRSHSSGVARHNRANGWDPAARIRIA
jgi:hypothetical protein